MKPTFRVETSADRAQVRRLVEAAFGDEGPVIADLIDVLRVHPCGRDHLSLVADVEGRTVGHAMLTRGRLDTFRRLVDVAVLAPVAVDPPHHGQGVGSALVRHALEVASQAGFPAVFLEGDPAYYGRLGFVAGKPLGFRKPSIRIPDDAFQVVLLPGYEEWMTGTLVYAEPFWDLDCVGLRDPAFLDWLGAEVVAGRQW
ncbi:MAG: N-acetyltransferase [Actinobacteria bacterium]|nr:N-acetyltransferase [Actinomycetota bacterium]